MVSAMESRKDKTVWDNLNIPGKWAGREGRIQYERGWLESASLEQYLSKYLKDVRDLASEYMKEEHSGQRNS